MQFVEKVAALRLFLGVPTELQLQPAVEHMNTMMGLVGDGALPLQVGRRCGEGRDVRVKGMVLP